MHSLTEKQLQTAEAAPAGIPPPSSAGLHRSTSDSCGLWSTYCVPAGDCGP